MIRELKGYLIRLLIANFMHFPVINYFEDLIEEAILKLKSNELHEKNSLTTFVCDIINCVGSIFMRIEPLEHTNVSYNEVLKKFSNLSFVIITSSSS